MKEYSIHPYAELFPLLDNQLLQELVDDIKVNGQQQRIVLDQHGRLVDGRNRLAACKLAGVEPLTEARSFADDSAILKFVTSANLHRRQLTPSQCAMIAAELANMKRGRNWESEKNKSLNLDFYPSDSDPPSPPAVSLEDAAQEMKVSRALAANAKKIINKGTAKLCQAVKDGKVKVSRAAKIADLSPEKQEQELSKTKPKKEPKAKGKKVEQKKEEPTISRMWKWASKKSRVTPEQLSEEFGVSADLCQRYLREACHSRGYLVEYISDGEYRIRKAVHFSWSNNNCDEEVGLKDALGKMLHMAEEAWKLQGSESGLTWKPADRSHFLTEIIGILKSLI